ncbi:unnamed protein product [Ascophyllum nodosum]
MPKSKEKESGGGKENKSKKRRREEKERSPSEEKHSSRRKKHSSQSSGGRDSITRKSSRRKSSGRKSSTRKSTSNNSSSSKDKKAKKKKKDKKGSREDEIEKEEESEKGNVQAEIQISEKDYFARAKEFKVWLFKKKKTFFEDLTSEQSHELFGKFVKDWNRGKLDKNFYEGSLPEELVARTNKTQHKWGFVKKLSDRDQMQLELANDSVHASTEVKGVSSNVPVLPAGSAESAVAGAGTGVVSSASRDGRRPERGNVGGKGNADKDKSDSERRSTAKKQKRRQEREKHAVVLDEIAPKETGRQATLDKRREVGARTHAAAREREDAADGLDMRESDIMGGGDGFQERLARAKMGQQRRQAAKTEHLQGLAAKEAEKRAAFMAQMGLKAGQKITIQPRKNG